MAKRIKLSNRQLEKIRPGMSLSEKPKQDKKPPKRYKVTSKGTRGITAPSSVRKKSSDRKWDPSKMKMDPSLRALAHGNLSFLKPKGPSKLPPGSKPSRRRRFSGGAESDNHLAYPGSIVKNQRLRKLLSDRYFRPYTEDLDITDEELKKR